MLLLKNRLLPLIKITTLLGILFAFFVMMSFCGQLPGGHHGSTTICDPLSMSPISLPNQGSLILAFLLLLVTFIWIFSLNITNHDLYRIFSRTIFNKDVFFFTISNLKIALARGIIHPRIYDSV